MSQNDENALSERLAKVLARAGVASRREAEKWIEEGRVEVNGETVYHPGHPVVPGRDHIRVDRKTIPESPPLVYYLLYKPRGTITGRNDPGGRASVLDLVEDLPHRVEPVGRLDMDTEGALLLTNDGELAHALTHPSREVPKRYLAKVWKRPTDEQLERLRRGIRLEDGMTKPAMCRIVESTDSDNCWVEITVTEGKNRLIRRMFEAISHPVSKLRRVSFATISIRGLERGMIRPLTGAEVQRLRDLAEGVAPERAGHSTKYKPGFARPKPKPLRPQGRRRKEARLRAEGKLKSPRPVGGASPKSTGGDGGAPRPTSGGGPKGGGGAKGGSRRG
jgi:pseudouridine synthase